MAADSQTIGFLLGSPDINGGTYVIYEHASRLQRMGINVAIITEHTVDPDRYSWHPAAKELEWITLDAAAAGKFDMVLATWWQSPFLLNRLDASHYVYFVQSIESRFFPAENSQDHDAKDLSLWRDFCHSTYSFNIPVITEARWIQEYLHQNFNNTAYLVRNGIRKDIYQQEGNFVSERDWGRLRVLVEGPVDVFYKNVPRSIELCRRAGVDEIWLLTSSPIASFPGADRVFSRVPIHETPAIYRSCDVLVKLSYIEGMFGPPLEMFHCGGTAIVYEVTGHDEYIVHDQNGYVVRQDDDEQVVAHLRELRNSPDTLSRLKRGAVETARSWPDWDASTEAFAGVLRAIGSGKPIAKKYIGLHTDRLQAARDNAFAARELKFFAEREGEFPTGGQTADNFIQLYWHEGQHFSQERCQCFHYTGGTDINASFELQINRYPFWIRVDPSVRIGVIAINAIRIIHQESGSLAHTFSSAGDFDGITFGGTISRIPSPKGALCVSYGADPQLILPPVQSGKPGDIFRIEISLKETGVGQFLGQHCSFTGKAVSGLKPPSWLERLIGKRQD